MTAHAATGELVDGALRLAALGWRIFPADPVKKKPLYTGWQRDATADPALVAQYLRGGRAMAATVTGEAFDVFDIEQPHLAALRDQLRATGADLPAMPVASTGRGGIHLYVQSTGLRNRDLFLNGVHIGETRGAGGLVIVPPSRSVHGPYRWIRPPETPLPDPPAVLLALLRSVAPAAPRRALATVCAAGLEALANWAANRPEGARNAGLNWAAWRAVQDGYPVDVVRSVMQRAGEATGLDPRAVEATVESAVKSGGARP